MHMLDAERQILVRVLCECVCRCFPDTVIFGATPHNMWISSQCPSVKSNNDTINLIFEIQDTSNASTQAFNVFKKLRAVLSPIGHLKQCKPPSKTKEFFKMQVMHLMFHYRCGYLQSTYNTLKIRINVVFCSKYDKMILLDNTTYLTAKSKQAKTLVEIQDLSKQSSKLQFNFNRF